MQRAQFCLQTNSFDDFDDFKVIADSIARELLEGTFFLAPITIENLSYRPRRDELDVISICVYYFEAMVDVNMTWDAIGCARLFQHELCPLWEEDLHNEEQLQQNEHCMCEAHTAMRRVSLHQLHRCTSRCTRRGFCYFEHELLDQTTIIGDYVNFRRDRNTDQKVVAYPAGAFARYDFHLGLSICVGSHSDEELDLEELDRQNQELLHEPAQKRQRRS